MGIDGRTELIALIGHPTHTVKSPMIYNPYFESAGINALVVPMDCRPEYFSVLMRGLFALENTRGALITMPHKVATLALLDEASVAVKVAGSCNAVKRTEDGRLVGDMFDGEGFVRGVRRKGLPLAGASALVVGSGGVGCAIAASLAGAGVATLALFDANAASAQALADRLRQHHPALRVLVGNKDPQGFDLVVNATPLGMNAGDPLPLDVDRLSPDTLVGEVVMKAEMTPLLQAARARGCPVQIGTDMLFEQIPAYLEFFGLPTATADQLRATAQLAY
ncbi:shikimate dehydrogenase family protein [Hydrogenophaga sp. ANAO-22]|uniref:shikimate dehydrogenase family protein n=1 Tax=Hydrogenophaga sp. ANAO-22 TaxID=3166645 RepID=UPI0036D39E7D